MAGQGSVEDAKVRDGEATIAITRAACAPQQMATDYIAILY
jgi:heat shock protein HslJ